MDFVVVGCGLGALIVLVGIAVRDLAPRLRRADPASSAAGDPRGIYSIQNISPEQWAGACRSASIAIMLGGALVIAATIGGIAAHLDDSSGARLVLGTILVAFGGIAVQLGMLASRLFPIDRRARVRARIAEMNSRQVNADADERSSAVESQPGTTALTVEIESGAPSAIGSNGASPEPAAVEATTETVSSIAKSDLPDDPPTAIATEAIAEDPPEAESATSEDDAAADTTSAAPAQVLTGDDTSPGTATDEKPDEATGESRTPADVAVTGRGEG